MEEKLICGKCRVPLEMKKVTLDYLGHPINHEFPCCPVCGEVYISEDIVRGKMHDVEMMLEEK